MLGEELAPAGLAHRVAGPADALQAAATAPGDSTWMTRSTAPMSMPSSRLEVATRPRSSPRFSWSSMTTRCSRASEPWWALTSSPVAPASMPSVSASSLRRAARRSARRRALQKMMVLRWAEHLLEDAGVDGGPDALARRPAGRRAAGRLVEHLAQLAHVLDGDDDLELERLADAGVDDGDRAGLAGPCVAAEEAGDLVEGPLRGRQADALRRPLAQLVEPLERQHEVRAPLGRRQRVDLVDDDGLDVAQGVPRPRGEHEVEALRGGDEQVGRVAHERLPVARATCRPCGRPRWAR